MSDTTRYLNKKLSDRGRAVPVAIRNDGRKNGSCAAKYGSQTGVAYGTVLVGMQSRNFGIETTPEIEPYEGIHRQEQGFRKKSDDK